MDYILTSPDERIVLNKKLILTGKPVDLTQDEVGTLAACGFELEPVVEEADTPEEEVVVEEVVEIELPSYQDQLKKLSEANRVPKERSKPSVEAAYIDLVLEQGE